MSQDRLLLRPADPTSRPRFDAAPGARIDLLEERARARRLMKVVLVGLSLLTVALVGLAIAQILTWWFPLIAGVALAVYLLGLRRAELERRARATRAATLARQESARRENSRRAASASASTDSSAPQPADASPAPAAREPLSTTTERAAHQVMTAGEWTPRPVPLPTYALRGEVDDLATRHAAHRQSMQSTSVPLESEAVEELEAVDEAFAPAQDLHLDEILARRRA